MRSPRSGIAYSDLPATFDAPLEDVGRFDGAIPLVHGGSSMLYFVGGARGVSPVIRNPWIFAIDLDGAQRRIPLQRQWAGPVVAAALDPSAPYLVAIDEDTDKFRLVRVHLGTGATTVVREFVKTNTTARHTLIAVPDGRFAAISTTLTGSLTRVVTFRWDAKGFFVDRRVSTSHQLSDGGMASASLEGVTIAGTPSGSSLWRPVGIRYSVSDARGPWPRPLALIGWATTRRATGS